ncbi:transcriptional regulator [Streptomyces niveus]|uniref:transcriptional regulator n=1 Tax=Streptomyces niveus TaxID=193462 RepID=UPI0036B63390
MGKDHPLRQLVRTNGGSALAYLRRLDEHHQRLGFGPIALDKKRVYRWISGQYDPELRAQLAMAAMHGIPEDLVHAHPWPAWLTHRPSDDRTYLATLWSPEQTDSALSHLAGGPMDRREFLIVSALGAVTAQWKTAPSATGAILRAGPRINAAVPSLHQDRLEALRLMDDHVGSDQVYRYAHQELAWITRTLTHSSCTESVRRQLYAAAAEASRICGWTAYDSGKHAAAERHYIAALKAAASADDKTLGANTLAFWAIQRYSTGDPRGAVHLVEAALEAAPAIGSPRLTAMLHARLGRAHAKTGDRTASERSAGAAFESYDNIEPGSREPACVYWVNRGELHQLAGSSALDLDRPHQALGHFTAPETAHEAYDEAAFPRGAAIYLSRESQAHFALGDIDGALDSAHRAVASMGGVTSARGTDTLAGLRDQLSERSDERSVQEFLASTG